MGSSWRRGQGWGPGRGSRSGEGSRFGSRLWSRLRGLGEGSRSGL